MVSGYKGTYNVHIVWFVGSKPQKTLQFNHSVYNCVNLKGPYISPKLGLQSRALYAILLC